MIEFFNTEKQITISDIEVIESQINLNFPKEYREHLLKYNGGQCIPNIFEFNENNRIMNSDIDWFLAIYDGEYDNLLRYILPLKIERKRLPTHILPIAHDSGGNLICISCGNNDYGCIYFWDHESEIDYSLYDDYNYQNLYLISKNLDLFFESLK
jgi:cell wall assembly regulator SMI1